MTNFTYLLVPLNTLPYVMVQIYITIMTSKSLLKRGLTRGKYSFLKHCNVDIINSLLPQNKCLPKCCKSKTTRSSHVCALGIQEEG